MQPLNLDKPEPAANDSGNQDTYGLQRYRACVSKLARSLQSWALTRPWPGRTGATDKAVYLAHLKIVLRCGQDPHGASVRELAELAGIVWGTAKNANHRLITARLLNLATRFTSTDPAYYSLIIPPSQDTLPGAVAGECALMTQSHDVFRFKALGKTGYDVWRSLLAHRSDSVWVNDIVAETGRKIRTVERKLARMQRLGMAERVARGYWRAFPDVDLDKAAEALDTSGMGERQRRKHQHDRELYNANLPRRQP
jgi:hypothetical protein